MTQLFKTRLLQGVVLIIPLFGLRGSILATKADRVRVVTVQSASGKAGTTTVKVLVNGRRVGRLPLRLALKPGRYLIEAEHPDPQYTPWRKWLDIAGGQLQSNPPPLVLDVVFRTRATGKAQAAPAPRQENRSKGDSPRTRRGSLSVEASVSGAKAFLDGKPAGRTPCHVDQLTSGAHLIRVEHPGYRTYFATVNVVPGQSVVRHRAVLVPLHKHPRRPNLAVRDKIITPKGLVQDAPQGRGSDDVALTARRSSASRNSVARGSRSAYTIRPGSLFFEGALGFPYLAEVRLSTGIFSGHMVSLDGSVGLRTYGAMTEALLLFKLGVLERGPWAVSTTMAMGGGGGPKGRNTFFFDISGLGSYRPAKDILLTGELIFDVYSDRHCSMQPGGSELAICATPGDNQRSIKMRKRFDGVRLMFSVAAHYALAKRINLFATMRFAPFQGNRAAFSDPYASLMPASDPGIYGQIGVVYRL